MPRTSTSHFPMQKRLFNIFSKPPPYKAVADEDTDDGHNESISEDSTKSNLLGYKLSRDETLSSPRRRFLLWLNVTLFTLSLFILMLSAILLSGIGRGRNAALKETSEYCMRPSTPIPLLFFGNS